MLIPCRPGAGQKMVDGGSGAGTRCGVGARRLAERQRQIVGTDEDAVESLHREDGVDVVEPGRSLDHRQRDDLGIGVREIVSAAIE